MLERDLSVADDDDDKKMILLIYQVNSLGLRLGVFTAPGLTV